MITIRLDDYLDSGECRSILHTCKDAFMSVTYEFRGGNTYAIISDFGCGSWGLATCLGGRARYQSDGVYLNDHRIDCHELRKHSCFVSERIYDRINREWRLLSPRLCIKKALKISGLPYKVDEIKEIFHLTDNRFDRRLDRVSGEIWIISIAVGFALGKDVFSFPWLNQMDIRRFDGMYELGIIEFLRKTEKIVIIPSSQMSLVEKCDHSIRFGLGEVIYG